MTQAFVCIGSNKGDAEQHLRKACSAIASIPGVRLAGASSLYQTEPQGRTDQPWFLNQVLRLDCEEGVTALSLLDAMLAKETELGRVRDANDRFGPRVIDMDLLLFGQETHGEDPHLILPHPRMHERAFVLVPLAELAPGLSVPGRDTVENLLKKLDYRLEGSAIFQ
ncbi:MAG: 2-amino-4-hydroxy-6-hydroxymethyldihydropteridine diphosphokinase [Mailhella sp.]|nr:2-amino-4-hydroxy-6-hydroxymethyldihydropteridine diphosphokinase [Mailhella sp.]